MAALLAAAAAASCGSAPGECPAGTWKSWVNGTFCAGMAKDADAATPDACAERCCSDPGCDVWEWCPERPAEPGGGGCSGWGSARCHYGPRASDCPAETHWVGRSRSPAPPTPPPPGPPAPAPGPRPPRATRKQGFSGFLGPNFSCDDAAALGLADSWFYTWMLNAAQYRTCDHDAAEFVPMINGVGQVDDGITNHFAKEWAEKNAHYLLGYNEPDYGNGHNHPHMVDPAPAARDWVKVQAVAEQLDLTLVSPGVSTTGLDDDGVSTWFDEFFGNCSAVEGCDGSRVAYIAFHDYSGNVSQVIGRAEALQRRYGRPTWVTEFAVQKWATPGLLNVTREMQDAYMTAALPALDASDAVFRYVWYTARDKPEVNVNGGGNLLEWNVSAPTLTSTGAIYKAHAGAP